MALYQTVKVSKRNQIAVPAVARERLNIQSGDRLIVDIQDGMIVLIPEPGNKDYVRNLAGLHQEIWEGIDAQHYVNEERNAWGSSTGSQKS